MSSLSLMAPPPVPKQPQQHKSVHGTTELRHSLTEPAAHVDSGGTSRIAEIRTATATAPRAAGIGKTPSPTSKQQAKQHHQHRQKVKEFNDVISCYLCGGYLINATTIDYCVHSFCRSCILVYLQNDNQCPKCKPHGKPITLENLRPDEKLKSLVFKLIPGLYQQERERQVQYYCKNSANVRPEDADDIGALDLDDDYFSPAEPISLSLEYHPALLSGCQGSAAAQIPQVKYLQCPAAVTVHHLKRFLCSKYDIDPFNPKVDIAVIYEEEILPENFSLMDVGYCYNWKRTAPMKFYYRIYVHSECNNVSAEADEAMGMETLCESKSDSNSSLLAAPRVEAAGHKIVRFKDIDEAISQDRSTYTVLHAKTSSKESDVMNNNNNDISSKSYVKPEERSVKVVISRKSPPSASPPSSVQSDFKSLRSNDMRYCDYTVSSSEQPVSKPKSEGPKLSAKLVSPCDIVVSIPHRSSKLNENSLENLSLAELKTAKGKKHSEESKERPHDLPKLKIKLEPHKDSKKSSKSRKDSMEVEAPIVDKVDLATYAKNIGLKPISAADKPKVSPDASPMSTSSSSASSSSSTFLFPHDSHSSSSHKKRKKAKHSKEPKESKRRKIHAEISSQPEDESLKLKVKITGNHKSHKTDSKKSVEPVVPMSPPVTPTPLLRPAIVPPTGLNGNSTAKTVLPVTKPSSKPIPVTRPFALETNGVAAAKKHVKPVEKTPTLIKPKPSPQIAAPSLPAASPLLSSMASISSSLKQLAPKTVTKLQDVKMPASPPLPPSLFKTTPITLQTITTTSAKPATAPKPTLVSTTPQPSKVVKGPVPKASAALPFVMPSSPKVPSGSNSNKLSHMSTIASAANRQSQLKRSASLDCPVESKHKKVEKDKHSRKPAYGPNMQTSTPKFTKSLTPPIVTTASQRSSDTPYYTSTMGPSYTREITGRKLMPMLLPPSSISVTKMNDAPAKTTGVTITAQKPKSPSSVPSKASSVPKPALEIVRISSNIPPMDLQPISTSSAPTNPTKTSSPKATRPPPPTIPLVKIKRSMNQSHGLKPAVTTVTAPLKQTTPPALISMKNIIPAIVASKSAATSAENAPKVPDSPDTNGKSDSSDSSIDVLDLSAGKPSPSPSPPKPATPQPEIGSLEAALNKLKQSIPSTHCTTVSYTNSVSSSTRVTPSEDLQNLHLLSESATSREKIAIKTRTLPIMPKLNEISKVRVGNASVRPQNASVRNIPNPSALVSRSIQPQPSPPRSPPTTPATNGNAEKPPSPKPSTPGPAQEVVAQKKNQNIEQVAANLNVRAAAAAEKTVSSTTSALPSPSASSGAVTSTVTTAQLISVASHAPPIVKQAPTTSFKSISSLVAPESSSPVSASIA